MGKSEAIDMKHKLKAEPHTPPELARELIKIVKFKYATEGDRWYEPFKGKGAFYNAMPEPKDWAEIEEGRDFFEYLPFDGHCEHIITNPPFRTYINSKWRNAYIPILERSMGIATKTVAFLTSHKIFNALTPQRLERYHSAGWKLTDIHVVNIRAWFGRYYFIVFSKAGKNLLTWDLKVW